MTVNKGELVLNRFFYSLRGKLTLTYTLVTVLALLALELMILLAGVALSSLTQTDRRDYLNDVINTLNPKASAFLQPGENNLAGLQAWLEGVYSSGFASGKPLNSFDSPAAPIVIADPMYVLAPDGTVLAQAPLEPSSLVGRRYVAPVPSPIDDLLRRVNNGVNDPLWLSTRTLGGNYVLAVPVRQSDRKSNLVGIILVTVKAPPPMLLTTLPTLLGWVLATGFILLLGVAPFGALFGYIMSRGLTRRLNALTAAADAWSEGNFIPLPADDRSGDEIAHLGQRMRNMAERIQDLLLSQKALAMLDERNRLARELHDSVKQQAFATLMQVRSARNLLDKDPQAAALRLEEAEALIRLSQQELGRIIAELRPAALGEQGLAGALRAYAESWSSAVHIPAEVQVRGERGLPIGVEQALFRIAQEALSNVARHSRASNARVQLACDPDQACLTITDNGDGFDPRAAQGAGFGLQSMRERLSALGGELRVESKAGAGTRLTAIVPIKNEILTREAL